MKEQFNIEQNLQLFRKIYDDGEVIAAVTEYVTSNYGEVVRYGKLLLKNRWTKLAKKPRILRLAAIVMSLATVRERFIKIGFDDEVFFNTMSDIKIWGEDCREQFGEIGIDEINWLRLHVNCQIFKIGRLQYQLSRYYFARKTVIGGVKIRRGEKCYNLHIPRGEPLDTDGCIESLNRAVKVLGKAFPKVRRDIMVCHSWMLSPSNASFVRSDGNIAKFAETFTLVGETPCASEHLRWIFGIRADEKLLQKNKATLGHYYDLSDFTTSSSLQRSAKEYIMQGGALSDGKGAIVVRPAGGAQPSFSPSDGDSSRFSS